MSVCLFVAKNLANRRTDLKSKTRKISLIKPLWEKPLETRGWGEAASKIIKSLESHIISTAQIRERQRERERERERMRKREKERERERKRERERERMRKREKERERE